jgi:glycerophosphoryl diester phosphodiesterase
MHAIAPEIRTAVLYNTELHTGRDAVEIAAELGATVFNIKRQRLTRIMLRRCREHGLPIGVYTVNKPRRMRRLVGKGINAIFTDRPDRLLDILRPVRDESTTPTLTPATAVP